MTTEQPGRGEAENWQRQESVRYFHDRLRRFYYFLKEQCEIYGRGACEETPKLVCFRSLREYPPIRCPLNEAGYFPLTVDRKFVEDVAIMEIDGLKAAKNITKKHSKRFVRMLGSMTFRLIRPPSRGPSETVLGM